MGFIQQLKQVKKKKAVRIAFSLFLILCSSLLQTYVIQSFINPANLLSAGFTGLAILLDRIAQLYGGMFLFSVCSINSAEQNLETLRFDHNLCI